MEKEEFMRFIEITFNAIQESEYLSQYEKDKETANLMSEMEDYMHMPFLWNDYWKAYTKQHPDLVQLYQKLSESRTSLWM